ncbi:MAG TPA: glycosyltransferase family 4 protein [Flavobacterium sp.]|uniref:glycosyltransferase family 4 protein n=1 Tax=unclassified Flavobacterium TaxID=196869 RepID=UPI0025C3CFF6|nr:MULTISPECIES: glycosyltransferase family 4 protein [unclassified Flavobacterium]HRE77338.1 glycosyltransferase family 4 protein [Flavobacterium sp.]
MLQNSKIKLLYITNGIKDPAGLERVLSVKASYLADELAYEVHILTLNNNGAVPFYTFSKKIIHHDIIVGRNPIHYFKSYLGGLKSKIKTIQPDIILVCDDGLKGFFLPLLLQKPCPMFYERHVSKVVELGEKPSFLKKVKVGAKFYLMKQLGKTFDKFIVLTPDNTKEWPMHNVMVIPNPLSFYPTDSSTLTQKKVIAVGKHSLQKGYDRLLQSWVTVQKAHPDWQLEIYGKIDEKYRLADLSRTLQVDKTVTFFPPVADIQSKYLDSSIFVLSSRFEGFGMVLIEAMACGVPCVTFDCPYGPADIVTHQQDGIVVPNDAIQPFANAISQLIEDEEQRMVMGKAAKQNVKRYLPEVVMPQWDALFKD